MNAVELLQELGESLSTAATVKSVFGEPIHAEGKTVVPVAKVQFGFGGGGGSNQKQNGDRAEPRGGEGGGGGGGLRAYPAGALEVTATGTHFVPFTDVPRLAAVFAAGALFGVLLTVRFWDR